ncbi:MAG: hypothetical protein R2834_01550 [Rhodothermales bacterium]
MAEISLELTPASRFDVIDISSRLKEHNADFFRTYDKALYCSFHTTAGYFEQSVCDRLNHSPDSVRAYVDGFKELFPPLANYCHDKLHLRTELTEEQKLSEPLNGDSHLTYISSGLENCVTYEHRGDMPVYFVDLDGECDGTKRRRKTTVIGYNREVPVHTIPLIVPVSGHRVDSVNLKDPRLGLMDQLDYEVRRLGIQQGRVEINLAPEEEGAALTVNEYETLLMQYDLAEILHNPMRFVAQKGWHMLKDPRAVPNKMLNYAKYDLVHVVNRTLDRLGLSTSLFGRGIQKVLAAQAARALQMKRSVRFLVADREQNQQPAIIHGTYQSPILIQWNRKHDRQRRLVATVMAFE